MIEILEPLYLRIAELEKEKSDLKDEIKKLKDIIVFLKKKYEDIGIMIEEKEVAFPDIADFKMNIVKYITIPKTTLAVPITTKRGEV